MEADDITDRFLNVGTSNQALYRKIAVALENPICKCTLNGQKKTLKCWRIRYEYIGAQRQPKRR